ncbi:MAG: NTP transferase domain-containing protein [Nitrospinaceae bacterium]|jgi:choline kinase|nr:MAG: NTP transferase domain-containing protein [Nitrospinaceae bacterium]
MHAVILLAGYGSRLSRDDLAHKSLLPFGGETLLSRHLAALHALGIEKAELVLGHNAGKVMDYVESLSVKPQVHYIDNTLYRTTGNTLSMVLGLERCPGDVLVLDGDVLYPHSLFLDYVRRSQPTSFALVPVDIGNTEATKVLINSSGTIHAFVTKRLLTEEEKTGFRFGGEAIGFFKLSAGDVQGFLKLYKEREAEYAKLLWEIPLTEFATRADIFPWTMEGDGCFEIDTPEDYVRARETYEKNPGRYA